MKLSVLIVDDEALARNRLRRLLQAERGIEVLQECADGSTAVAAIHSHRPDLVFLDVQMPEMNGFEVVAAVGPQHMPAVIFVTAHDRFALQAFEAQALDYLLKPFGAERVQHAVARARRFAAGGAQQELQEKLFQLLQTTSGRGAASLLVKRRDRVVVLNPADIDWIEADGDYVRLHAKTESHLLRATLTEMERRLQAEGFVRIHRSRLVNWTRVKEFTEQSEQAAEVLLKSGERLTASRVYLRALQRRLEAMP